VYKTIIDRIIEAAQTVCEEGGYDQQTLQDLKHFWQQGLTNLRVGALPWDPVPPPQPHPTTLGSNVKAEVKPPIKQDPSKQEIKYEQQAQIKQEPYDPSYPNGYSGPTSIVNPRAAERAADNLRQQFGERANASIVAGGLHQNRPAQMQGQQRQPNGLQFPGQTPRQPPQNYQNIPQADGSGEAEEWEQIVAARAVNEGERQVVDGMLRRHLEQSTAFIESGLMMPMSERIKTKGKARPSLQPQAEASNAQSSSTAPKRLPQMDGDDEDDEDAINSALDDSEDDLDNPEEGDDDGPLGETILCTYDKVQRVKNKWKCTLKDGILTTNGKEYLFHKAQGEFEW